MTLSDSVSKKFKMAKKATETDRESRVNITMMQLKRDEYNDGEESTEEHLERSL